MVEEALCEERYQAVDGISSPTTLLSSDGIYLSPSYSYETPLHHSCDASEMFGFCISSFSTHCDQIPSRNYLREEPFALAQEEGMYGGGSGVVGV